MPIRKSRVPSKPVRRILSLKPWEKEKLLATLSAALKLRESRTEVQSLKRQVAALESSDEEGFEIIGESNAMQEIFATIEKLRHTDANILILGRTEQVRILLPVPCIIIRRVMDRSL